MNEFWTTTGAFLVAECGLCGARAVNGIYRGKPGPAPFRMWCHEGGQGSPYQNSVRESAATAEPAGRCSRHRPRPSAVGQLWPKGSELLVLPAA